jgi:transcriptional regulator with XRE-family HTH domain
VFYTDNPKQNLEGVVYFYHREENVMTFGEYFRELRLAENLSLREFCRRGELDPSNWSKIERDRLPVNLEREKLETIARLVGLKKGSTDWLKFFDLACISRRQIPSDVYEDEEVVSALPIFFRTVRGDKPSRKELAKLFNLLKNR